MRSNPIAHPDNAGKTSHASMLKKDDVNRDKQIDKKVRLMEKFFEKHTKRKTC